jgi:F-type H+-transporting ATPase subunit a
MESIQNFFTNFWEKFKAWIEANPTRAGLWAAAIILFIVGLFIPVDTPHVALSGEPLFSNGPAWFTNAVLTTIIVDIVLILISVLATARMSLVPSGLQNFMEMVIEALYNLSESVAGDRARQFFPFVATIFLFVLLSNYSGLIPGVGSIGYFHEEAHVEEAGGHAINLDGQLAMADGNLIFMQPAANELAPLAQAATPEAQEEHPTDETAAEAEHGPKFVPLFRAPSTDLNMTFALAIATMVTVQIWGVRSQGAAYFKKFLNASGKGAMKGISIFVSFLEIVSEFARIIAFGFRLFGNIFAGEVVLATMAFLIPFFLPLPFYVLEVGVGAIQALVFMMLALVFFTMATIAHGHEEHHDMPAADESHEADVDVFPGTVAPEGSH